MATFSDIPYLANRIKELKEIKDSYLEDMRADAAAAIQEKIVWTKLELVKLVNAL